MDPDRYCLDEAAPPGSSLYYATLFAGARERAALVAVHALRHALLDIVDTVADANVRAAKLNWWSGEIMEARDGRPHHPVSVAISRHCGALLWRRPGVLAMLSAVARVSTNNGFVSEAARDEFCEQFGGGTAQLCMTAAAGVAGAGAPVDIRTLGTALEGAILAGAPNGRPGLRRVPVSAPRSIGRVDLDGFDANPGRIAEERARARQALADAIRGVPPHIGAAPLVYRTLAHIQLAALEQAFRRPAGNAPSAASISPIRKLWIAWRASRGVAHGDA